MTAAAASTSASAAPSPTYAPVSGVWAALPAGGSSTRRPSASASSVADAPTTSPATATPRHAP